MNSFLWSARAVSLVAFSTFVGMAVATPQAGKPEKAGLPGGGNWMPSKMSPLQLASKVERKMAGLTAVGGFYEMRAKWVLGTVNPFHGKIEIKNPTTYRIEYLGIGTEEHNGAATCAIIADGKRFVDEGIQGTTKPVPFAKRKLLPAKLMPEIGLRFDKWLLASIGGGLRPLTALVKEVNQTGSAYTLKCEEIHGEAKGKKTLNYRFRIERKPKLAKTVGVFFAEFDIDGRYWLPIMVRVTDRHVAKPSTSILSETRYFWNMNPGQKFDAQRFAIRG